MPLTIQELRDISKEEEAYYLSLISEGKTNLNWPSLLATMAMLNQAFAVYEITAKQFAAAKQHYYLYGRLQGLTIKKYNARLFDYDIASVGNVLLSDNEQLIREFAGLRYVAGDNAEKDMEEMVATGQTPIWCHTMFMFILDDVQIIERNLRLIETVTLKRGKLMQPDLDFFRALSGGDIKAMEKALRGLLSATVHKKRSASVVFAQHISQAALTYAKLAWYKGFEVMIDHPLIPAEMLPVKPLDTYENTYSFL